MGIRVDLVQNCLYRASARTHLTDEVCAKWSFNLNAKAGSTTSLDLELPLTSPIITPTILNCGNIEVQYVLVVSIKTGWFEALEGEMPVMIGNLATKGAFMKPEEPTIMVEDVDNGDIRPADKLENGANASSGLYPSGNYRLSIVVC